MDHAKEQLTGVGGLLPTPPDPRDFSHSQVFGALAELPTGDFTVAEPLKIKNQGSTDFCTGYAVTSVSEDQEGLELDPHYQFAKTKQLMGDYAPWGADLRTAMKSCVKFGSISPKAVPFSVDKDNRNQVANWKNWPVSLDSKAEEHAKASYFSVDGPYDLFDNMRMTLWMNRKEKRSIATGCLWRSDWTNAPNGIVPRVGDKNALTTAHAFKVFGQKVIGGEVYLVAQNSAGTKVGDNGCFYFPREVVNRDFTYGAYTFRDIDPAFVRENLLQQLSLAQLALKLLTELARRIFPKT